MMNTEEMLHWRLLDFVGANMSISQCLYMGYIQQRTGMLFLETIGKYTNVEGKALDYQNLRTKL